MNIIRVSNSLDPKCRPDLSPNCLQRLSADDRSRQMVNIGVVFRKVTYTSIDE